MMRVTAWDRESLSKGVIERWCDQYRYSNDESKHAITNELRKLTVLTPDDVDRITGNRSWTTYVCDHCGEAASSGVTVEIINEDWDTSTEFNLCTKDANNFTEVWRQFNSGE